MARVAPLEPDQLTDLQRQLAAEIASTRGGGRGTLAGPWGLLLRSERICEHAARFGTMLRDSTSLDPRLSELAIAITARFWTAQYEWGAHAPRAVRAGVGQDVIDSIRDRRRPEFAQHDEAVVYEYVKELLETKRVSDRTYKALIEVVGADAAVELTAIVGFYTTVAMLIVAFEVDLPEGRTPGLPE